MNAQLHILTGDEQRYIANLLPYMTENEQDVVFDAYPELLGGLFTLIASGVAAGVSGIVGAVKKRKAQKASDKATKAAIAEAEKQAAAQVALQEAQIRRDDQQQKIILFAGIGLGAIILLKGMRRKKGKRGK